MLSSDVEPRPRSTSPNTDSLPPHIRTPVDPLLMIAHLLTASIHTVPNSDAFNISALALTSHTTSAIMSGPGAGHEFPSTEVSWMKRDVLLFAYSIGCTVDELHFLYVRACLPVKLSGKLTTVHHRSCTRTSRSSLRTLSSYVSLPACKRLL